MSRWFIILYFSNSALYGQADLDDLIHRYKDSLRYHPVKEEWYGKTAHLYLQKREYDSAKKYFSKALRARDAWSSPEGRAYLLNSLGVAFYSTGQMDSSIYFYQLAKELYESTGNLPRLAFISINLGIIYKDRGLYDLALDYLLEGAKYLDNSQYRKELSSCYNTIAIVYSRQQDHVNSLNYHRQALKIREKLDLLRERSSSLNNIGAIYSKLENYDSALFYYERALELKKELKDDRRIASTLNNIGLIHLEQGRSRQAEEYLGQALQIHSDRPDEIGKSITLNNLGRLYTLQEKYDQALVFLDQAYRLVKDHGLLAELKENLEIRIQVQVGLEQPLLALATAKQLASVKDSLLNREKIRSLTQMQTQYETEKKEQEIQLLRQKQVLQETHLKLRQSWIWGLAIFCFLVMIIVLLVWGRWKREQKSRDQYETLLKELYHRVKNNLQLLSSIFGLHVRTLKDQHTVEAVRSAENRVNAMAIIHQKLYANARTRTINIKDYLQDLIFEIAESYGIAASEDNIHLLLDDLDLDVNEVIYIGLVVNELVSNAFKYVFPGNPVPKLMVRLEKTGSRLELVVEDNGRGFEKKPSDTSMGLNIVETLARQLGGKIQWETTDGVKFKLELER